MVQLNNETKIKEFIRTPREEWKLKYSPDEIKRYKNRVKKRAIQNLNELAYIAMFSDKSYAKEIFDFDILYMLLLCVSERIGDEKVNSHIGIVPLIGKYYSLLIDAIIQGRNVENKDTELLSATIQVHPPFHPQDGAFNSTKENDGWRKHLDSRVDLHSRKKADYVILNSEGKVIERGRSPSG
jgi:hypothetical protein